MFKYQLSEDILFKKSNVVSLKKVPKREMFVTEIFTLSDPIWKDDLRTEPKNPFVAPSSNLGSAPHSGDTLPDTAAMKKLERNSANVMNKCV